MQRYCLGRGTVLGLLAAAGVTMRHQGLSEIETGAAAALYARGMSVVSVADRLERPMSTVYLALKRAGVVMRPRQGGRR
jgi:transposase